MSITPAIMQWMPLASKWSVLLPPLNALEILAIVTNESSGNPEAFNPADPSWGLMGVSPLIATFYGNFDKLDESWHTDPDKNMKAGARFLNHLKTKWSTAFPDYQWVAAYNEGEGQLQRGAKDLPYVTAFKEHLAELTASQQPPL